jgi:shikimate 5-dehydrogenase
MLDGLAFVEAQKRNEVEIAGQRALLIGAGAAGRAIALVSSTLASANSLFTTRTSRASRHCSI